ncbi:Crp/Fnr family transcriptional regulator [Polaribacter sp. R77954]|uniref:Crp/Fnr family transcriptional regulator n=1 Tax=Polaribacter sp. R77954 TaxID=3093870 RepID=UPI0037C9E447
MFSLQQFTNKFKDLPAKSLDAFVNLATEETFKKNDFFIKEGEVGKDFYIVKSGIVRSFYADEKGKEHTRTIFTAGKTTGALSSLVSGMPSILTYECLTDCTVYKIVYQDFMALTLKDHHILRFYNQMLEKVFLLLEARIYELAVLNATERYLKLKKEIPQIETLIPQYHIASYLNISAVQLSRIRKEIYSK